MIANISNPIRPSSSWKIVVEQGTPKHTPLMSPPAIAISTTSAGVAKNAGKRHADLSDDEACEDDDDEDDEDDVYPAAAVYLLPICPILFAPSVYFPFAEAELSIHIIQLGRLKPSLCG